MDKPCSIEFPLKEKDYRQVDYVEIWETSGKSPFKVAKKLIAILGNGYPLYLDKDFMCERSLRNRK